MPALPEPATGAISFQYLAEIAVGATARVDLCRAIGGSHGGQLLAVKRLHPHIAEDPTFANMFLDEVWMTAALKHPNVVEVAGWGTDAQGVYLAVELVQGVSLARLMKTVFETGEVFTERMVVFVASHLAAGLAAAHELKSPEGEHLHLVHRDLAPGNVLMSFSGGVKIADFGLAKAKQRVTKTLTGLLKGKPQYMAPEQARGGELDGRADLFSLGVVLFELFAGRRPWSATSEMQMMHVTQNDPPIDLRECRPKIDKELVAIVMRCLEKDPAARFQRAEEILVRLEQWLSAHGYMEGNEEALARFVRRNAMKQMRWFERAVAGELAPADSSRPSSRPEPPRVPSYADSSDAGAMPSRPSGADAKRARVKPRKSVDSDATNVTAAEARMAAFRAEPTAPAARIVDATPQSYPQVDESELVPTLVQKASTQLADLRARAVSKALAARGAAASAIVDEESDQRTTAVREDSPASGLRVHDIADPESADAPTQPLSARRQAGLGALRTGSASASAGPDTGRLPGQIAPPSPGVPPPPLAHQSPSSPQGAPSAPADASPAAAPPAPGASPPLTEAVLMREADRLALEALRLGEEARAATALAVGKTHLAKVAGEAATMAAEAVRIAANQGLAAAGPRLEQAMALEQSLRRGSLPPPASPEPPRPPPRADAFAGPESPRPALARSRNIAPPPTAPAAASAASGDTEMFAIRLRSGFGGMRREAVIAVAGGAVLVLVLILWLALR